jgi:hypothetical protein
VRVADLGPAPENPSKRLARVEFHPPLVRWLEGQSWVDDRPLYVATLGGRPLVTRARANKLGWASSWSARCPDYADAEIAKRTCEDVVEVGCGRRTCVVLVVVHATVAFDPPPPQSGGIRYPEERSELALLARWVLDGGPARERAAAVVQRAWRRCVADPAYVLCRRRLLREFGEDVRTLSVLSLSRGSARS